VLAIVAVSGETVSLRSCQSKRDFAGARGTYAAASRTASGTHGDRRGSALACPVFNLQPGEVVKIGFVVGHQRRVQPVRMRGNQAVERIAAAVADGGAEFAETFGRGAVEGDHGDAASEL